MSEEIYLQSSSDIQNVISELTKLNKLFRDKTEDIVKEQTALNEKWGGEASEVFIERIRREKVGYENFALAIDEYVRALQDILAIWESKEAKAISISEQ